MPASMNTNGGLDLDKVTADLNSSGNGPSYHAPKSIVDAVSEIQQYHVFEKQQEKDIDRNFFTLRQVFDFIKVGFKNGLLESFVFVTLLPFFQTIYPSFKYYFFREPFTEIEKILLISISYIPVILITIWLTSLFRLYEGAITKKAIFSLLLGRTIAFLIKGTIVFFLFSYLYELAYYDKEQTYVVIDTIKRSMDWILFFTEHTYSTIDLYTYYYIFIVPAIQTTAEEAMVSMTIFALIPFLSIVYKGFYLSYKIKKSEDDYEQY